MKTTHSRTCLLLLSWCSFLALVSPTSIRGIIGTFFFGWIAFFCVLFLAKRKVQAVRNAPDKLRLGTSLVASIAIILFLLRAYSMRWLPSSKILAISSALHLSQRVFVYGTGIFFSVGAGFIVYTVVHALTPKKSVLQDCLQVQCDRDTAKAIDHTTKLERLLILFCAVIAVSICSKSSPLYPLNNWDDVNCFFTVGKGMMNGFVPYRDLFEQKGPLLYLLYGLAWILSHDTFLGGYVLEIIAGYFYLLYSFRITILLLKKHVLALIPVLAVLSYTSIAFQQGGSAEELCWPLLSFSLWVMIRESLDSGMVSKIHFMLLGVVAGCVFWIKFTLVGLYAGWYLWLFWDSIRSRSGKEFLKKTVQIAAGVVIATVPWVIYFGVNRALGDWLEVYLLDNIFVYSNLTAQTDAASGSVLKYLWDGASNILQFNPAALFFCAGSFLLLVDQKKEKPARMLMLAMLGAFVFIYIGGRRFKYYSLAMDVFFAPSIALLFRLLFRGRTIPHAKAVLASSVLIGIGCLFLLSPNRYFMSAKKSDLAQYRFLEIIHSESDNATLLNYGFLDGGFYTVCDILPNCKAFCGLNIPLDELKELQDYYVDHGMCDYVITCTDLGETDEKKFALYECVAECASDYSWGYKLYRLYQLRDQTG